MERIHKVSIYVSPAELQAIRIAAAHAGQSMSEYARSVTLAATEQPKKGDKK